MCAKTSAYPPEGGQTPGPAPAQMCPPDDIRPLGERPHDCRRDSPMLRSRLLISVLVIACALGIALLKPLAGRADDGDPPPPDPTPPTNSNPVIPPLPVFRRKARQHENDPVASRVRHCGSSTTRSASGASATSTAAARPAPASTAPASSASSTRTSASPSPTRATPSSTAAAASAAPPLRPGDLVFFDGLGHVGIYVGNGRFIHAPHTGTRVQIQTLGGWYSSRFDGARRLRT